MMNSVECACTDVKTEVKNEAEEKDIQCNSNSFENMCCEHHEKYDHIKKEKEEQEDDKKEVTNVLKAGSFICETCSGHFFYEKYYNEHVKEHHQETVAQNEVTELISPSMQMLLDSNNAMNEDDQESPLPIREQSGNNALNVLSSADQGSTTSQLTVQDFSECNTETISPPKPHEDVSSRKSKQRKVRKRNSKCDDRPFPFMRCACKTHKKQKTYTCRRCSFTTSDGLEFATHKKIHADEPYVCPDCSYSTKHKAVLRAHHSRMHTNEKPFKCQFSSCTFAAKAKRTLVTHMRNNHTDLFKFRCSNCPYTSSIQSSLQYHQKTCQSLLYVKDC